MESPNPSVFNPFPLSVGVPLLTLCLVVLVFSHEIAQKLVACFAPSSPPAAGEKKRA